MSGRHSITAEVLPEGERAWYGAEVLLRTDRDWFPTTDLFDARRDGRYAPKPEVPSATLAGSMGSACCGVSLADLPAAERLLRDAGHAVTRGEPAWRAVLRDSKTPSA